MTGSNVAVAATGPGSPGYTWLMFALMTVSCWGLYGLTLHSGVMAFDPKTDPNARYKAFFFVGIAYFIIAVLAPILMLVWSGASWHFFGNVKGVSWSLFAGIVGAVGAFGVLLAFGAKGQPAVVMSIIFAGAPVVNAIVALILHPPKGGLGALRIPFVLGILLAALGGYLVTRYKPEPAKVTGTPIMAKSNDQATD